MSNRSLAVRLRQILKNEPKQSQQSLPTGRAKPKGDDGTANLIGPAATHLLNEMEQMYWQEVESDIEQIILALQDWQHPDFHDLDQDEDELEGDDESNSKVHDFDSFLGQVNAATRRKAEDYRKLKKATRESRYAGMGLSFENALRTRARILRADQQSQKLRADVYANLRHERTSQIERRVRRLLQSATWLDMDKLVEHRQPLPSNMKFWKRPSPSQLQLTGVDSCGLPLYEPLQCTICTNKIRGTMFRYDPRSITDKKANEDPGMICQDCYDDNQDLRQEQLVKVLKHSVVDKTISPTISQAVCKCVTVARVNERRQPRALFPMSIAEGAQHRSKSKALTCGLLCFNQVIAEAKFAGMLGRTEKRITLAEDLRRAKIARARKMNSRRRANRRTKRVADPDGDSAELLEEDAARDVPWFLKPYLKKYAFGNVHMALRFGPLVIENGVPQTHRGAVVTRRPPLCLRMHNSSLKGNKNRLIIGEDRLVRSQVWPQENKRYKAVMKQVVGGAFAGLLNKGAEDEIIQALVECGRIDMTGLDTHEMKSVVSQFVRVIFPKVQALLKPQVDIYLQSLSSQLTSQTVLKWSSTSNNCQMFCDSLIDTSLFGPLVPSMNDPTKILMAAPYYLLSFVCRPSAYAPTKVTTKFDVPNGLVEEYLLSYRYGRHVDSDLIDSLSEYWYDWGAFDSHLYRNQDLFPWDCTEAYAGTSKLCGKCTLSKHVWAFPFDSFSIAAMHLTRPRSLYNGELADREWISNRLRVVAAYEQLLIGARAMAESMQFRKATAWLENTTDPRHERLKLGGIHRAQPYSHQYEQGVYHMYFTASWVHLRLPDRIKTYETLRQIRVNLPDVKTPKSWDPIDRYEADWSVDFDVLAFEAGAYAGIVASEEMTSDANTDGHGDSMGAYCADGWDGSCGMYGDNEAAVEAAAFADDNVDPGCGGDGCGGGCGGD